MVYLKTTDLAFFLLRFKTGFKIWRQEFLSNAMELSLDKTESLDFQITSPLNKKIGCFCEAIFVILSLKQPSFLLNGEVIWQTSDYSLSKELHANALKTSGQKNLSEFKAERRNILSNHSTVF